MQITGFFLVLFWDKIPFFRSDGDAVRFTFLLVGLWWIGFAQITFRRLPKGEPLEKHHNRKNIISGGFTELKKVLSQLLKFPVLKRFLFSFFFIIWECRR